MHDLPASRALLADLGLRSGRRARPLACPARRAAHDAHVLGRAGRGLAQRDRYRRLDVGAPRRPAPAAALAPEDVTEDVGEGREDVAHVAEALTAHLARPRVTEAVVEAALLGIAEDLVRLRGLLEPVLRRLVTGVAIGVQLHGELAVGALELGGVGGARDAQDLVVVPLLRHG